MSLETLVAVSALPLNDLRRKVVENDLDVME